MYRTVDDMYNRGTPVELTDQWTPSLTQYRNRPAVVIDVEVLGYPRPLSRQVGGQTISEKYDSIYTIVLKPEGPSIPSARPDAQVIRVTSLDVSRTLPLEGDLAPFTDWCIREFCSSNPLPTPKVSPPSPGQVVAGVVMPHTIPLYEAQFRDGDHRRESLKAIARVKECLGQWKPDVILLASTHWMPQDGFYLDNGATHENGCDSAYAGIEPQRFSFPGDPELAALAGSLGCQAGLPVKQIHRVAQEHAVWVPLHLLSGDRPIPVVPCSIWWRGPGESHRRWGEVLAEAVRQAGRHALFIASGALSHSFDFSKPPDHVVPGGKRVDEKVIKWLGSGDHDQLLEMEKSEFETWNPEGRAGHLYMLRGALDKDVGGELLCYQGSNGTGYVTMTFET